ncbi:MAG: glycosyltransferase [Gammaproteobacteria bacterium]|nr:glycosyltransferase [Gammaproteobacteria bacterium]
MISVIIPNLNDARIVEAVDELSQSSYICEILIVDGKSTNLKVLNFYNKLKIGKVKVLHYEDKGIFDSINYGIHQSKGDVIFLQGADDIISNIDVFEDVHNFLEENTSYHGFCIGCKFIDNNQKVVREWHPGPISRNKILLGILPPHFSLFLRKDVYEIIGDFEVSDKGDFSLDSIWLIKMGMFIKNLKICINKRYYLNMAIGGFSTSSLSMIFKQNTRLFYLLKDKKWKPIFWYAIPFIKVISKLMQVKIISKIK